MSHDRETPPSPPVGWVDLTVGDAPRVRDFYRDVLGWHVSEVEMGEYSDYCLHPAADAPPALGVCHARGVNAGLPAQWLIYLTVPDLAACMARCRDLGGAVLHESPSEGGGGYAVIRDPAGAVAALYQPAPPQEPLARTVQFAQV